METNENKNTMDQKFGDSEKAFLRGEIYTGTTLCQETRKTRGQGYPDTKTRQRPHTQKGKLQVNIPGEHRCKHPQQNISQLC